MKQFDAGLTAEMRAATAGFKLYNDGPGVSYVGTEIAYTAGITLLHLPEGEPSSESEILLVQKGEGDWHERVWGSVTGYVDTMYDPAGQLPDNEFDPLAFTVWSELQEECGLPINVIDGIDFRLGTRFNEPRFNSKGMAHILPILGICRNAERPDIQPDGKELLDHAWVPIGRVAEQENLSPGYITDTLPGALAGLGGSVLHLLR
jgi:hypothetical protein